MERLNRWSGSNRSGYNNPNVDALYDKLAITIEPNQRVDLHKQLLEEALNDVSIIPLWWEYAPILALKGVRGIGALIDTSNTWNVFEWSKD